MTKKQRDSIMAICNDKDAFSCNLIYKKCGPMERHNYIRLMAPDFAAASAWLHAATPNYEERKAHRLLSVALYYEITKNEKL